jgi:hypothetical protein
MNGHVIVNIDLERMLRKKSWCGVKYYPRIFLKGLSKTKNKADS